jgi:hypothetical protein
MGTGMIEIADVLGEHFEQMALAQDDDVIETFTTHATEEAHRSHSYLACARRS